MLARLWWKEYRAFGPVWLILGLAAGLLQWLFLSVNSADVRSGALTNAALAWAVLYAFASGAAAFSAERETKTLAFLDALPVGRGILWLGKSSFALVSTLGLALILAGMAELGTEKRDAIAGYGYEPIANLFLPLLFEAVAWSLLWSSLSKNPLISGVMGVLSVFASMSLMAALEGTSDLFSPRTAVLRLIAAFLALMISGLVMAWRPSLGRLKRKRRAHRPPDQVPIRSSSTGRSLAWQAWREGRSTWLLVAVVGLVIPIGSSQLTSPFDNSLVSLLVVLASLVAGVSVFGTETASGPRRFLVHHGVKPGTAWWRKLLVWGLGMGVVFGVMAAMSTLYGQGSVVQGVKISEWLFLLWLGVANAFVVGLLCGMVITRRITATLVGVIVLIMIVPIQVTLAVKGMIPGWSLVLIPSIFVAVSRAWAADWLLESEGARPWIRLATWLLVPFGLLGMSYVTYRAFGMADVGPQFTEANLQSSPIPIEQDAADAYRRAEALIQTQPSIPNAQNGTTATLIEQWIEDGWKPSKETAIPMEEIAKLIDYWKKNQGAIEQARKASILPQGRFEDVRRMTVASGSGLRHKDLRALDQLLALDTRERLARGDLPGAWEDIIAQLRMASQLGRDLPTLSRMMLAVEAHHLAIGLAFDWLGSPGQAPELILRASKDLKALPTLPNLVATMQVETAMIERSLDLTSNELAEAILPGQYGPGRNPSPLEHLWFARVAAPPWERQRSRRVCRLLIARELPEAMVEPFQSSNPDRRLWSGWEEEFLQESVLTRSIMPNFQGVVSKLDRELVGRRALDQAVAIEAWKLGHEGKYPEKLEALVPEFLDRLPLDPYSGLPFLYQPSDGRPVRPPILDDIDTLNRLQTTRPGQPLLYSVGINKTNESNNPHIWNNPNFYDYVYAIP